jgi:hypothetical protein
MAGYSVLAISPSGGANNATTNHAFQAGRYIIFTWGDQGGGSAVLINGVNATTLVGDSTPGGGNNLRVKAWEYISPSAGTRSVNIESGWNSRVTHIVQVTGVAGVKASYAYRGAFNGSPLDGTADGSTLGLGMVLATGGMSAGGTLTSTGNTGEGQFFLVTFTASGTQTYAGGSGAQAALALGFDPAVVIDPVYKGASTRANRYKGARTDAQLYLGAKVLFP